MFISPHFPDRHGRFPGHWAAGFSRLVLGFSVVALPAIAGAEETHDASDAWRMPVAADAKVASASSPAQVAPPLGRPAPFSASEDFRAQPIGNAPPSTGARARGDRVDETEPDDDPLAPPNFDLALATLFPLSLGPQLTVELPGRLLIQADVGWMPPAYGSLINRMVRGFGGHDAAYQALVDGALNDALVVRASGGWRPFPGAGFEVFGGYTLVDLNGAVEPAAVAAVVDGEFAAAVAAGTLGERIELDSTLHSFHVGLGWRWVVIDHLIIRANLSYMQTVSSSSRVTTPSEPALGERATPVVDETLDDIYQQYVKLPVIGLSGGYRF
jgi:hypothetical protein